MLPLLLACAQVGDSGLARPVPEVVPAAPALRRLTEAQYHSAIRDLLGPDLVLPSRLEPDVQVEGLLSVGASVAMVSPWGVERYEQAALDLVEQALESPDNRVVMLSCEPSELDDPCLERALDEFGLRAWRRRLTEAELDRILGLVEGITLDSGELDIGLLYGLGALLQSPHFLYRSEHGLDPAGAALTDYELATRLSFLLWNAIPDQELLLAAEAGELSTDEGLEVQALRMLEDERAGQGLRNLLTELYTLYELDDLDKDPLVFTHASAELGPAAREETLLVAEQLLLDEDGDYRRLISQNRSFVDPRLAALYGIPAPDPEGFGQVWLDPDQGRRGLLGQASVLAQFSHATSSSATLRGKFIRSVLLCHEIPAPPGDVDTTIPEADSTSPTLRDRIAVHMENPSCSGCHLLTDPMGLALENFDGVGRWRDSENGATIDASGELDGETWQTPWELPEVLAEHPDLGPCFSENVYRYAVGHSLQSGEEELGEWLAVEFEIADYSYRSLVLETVMSPGFRNVGAYE